MENTGRVYSSWNLATEYGFTDVDGQQPHWGNHFAGTYGKQLKSCDEAFYEYWWDNPLAVVLPDWP